MTCPNCGRSATPDDRFCAGCGTPLTRRCVTCGTALPDDARFCPSCGTAVDAAPAPDDNLERAGEERKIVSVLFADLVGFTESSDGEDPEDVRRRLAPYHTALRDEVERYGGRIEKLMGDGVLAVFGAPVVHEDDPERAVRAALRIQEAVESLAGTTGLKARVAVATGEVVVQIEGTTMDREGLVGDVVNTASRLQHEAPPGTVLVDAATHRSTHRMFRYEERPPVAVKGKREPLAVWIALEPTGRIGTEFREHLGTSLVGREHELALLVNAFSRSVDEQTSQLVTIGGEPGVGKSRMVEELRRHIDSLPDLIRWRQGRCLPYGEGITYWALSEIVKAEAGILETDTPATALGKLGVALEALLSDPEERTWVLTRLAPLVGSEQETAVDKAERFAAWHRLVSAMGEQRPTVLVIDDLQWADPSLVEFLAEVPDVARGIPVLLVCTARPEFFQEHPTWGGGQANAVTVRLDPLDEEATGALLDELLADDDLDEETRREITIRCGGNPLWAQEFVRMLRERPSGGELAIPDTVQSIVSARVDLLDPEVKSVIQAAATVGKSFWTGAVAAALDEADDLDSALRELNRRELVRRERTSTVAGESEYAFTHAVVRDVAYAQTPRAVRARRHHTVARWLEDLPGERVADRAEVIAHHDAEALRLATATDMADVTEFIEAAITSHRRAAEQAARLDLNAQLGHLEAALELVPQGEGRRGRLLYDLGVVLTDLGRVDEGEKALLEARDELRANEDFEAWGMTLAKLGQFAWVTGRPEQARAYSEEAIGELEELPPGPALAQLYSHQAGSYWLRGDSEKAIEAVERVRPIVEVHGELEARRRILWADGGARFDLGDPSGIEPFRQTLRMAIESDDSMAIVVSHLNLGEQLRTAFGPEEAIAVHERGRELAIKRGVVSGRRFIEGSLAVDYFIAGRWDDALAVVESALDSPERLSYVEGTFLGVKAMLDASRGEAPSDVGQTVDGLVAQAEEMKDLQAVVPTHEGAMWVKLASGDEQGALAHAHTVVELSGATRYLLDSFPVIWVLARAGELERVGDLLPELRRFDMPRPRAQLSVIDELLTDGPETGTIAELAEELMGMGAVLDAFAALAAGAEVTEGDALSQQASALLEPLQARALIDLV